MSTLEAFGFLSTPGPRVQASAPTPRANTKTTPHRETRKVIAEETLAAIKRGVYTINGSSYPLPAPKTLYFAPDSSLTAWRNQSPPSSSAFATITLLDTTTLECARALDAKLNPGALAHRVGVLNFASASKPGGGFLSGAQAQEESIARSSTLYPSLVSPIGQAFYDSNQAGRKGYYTHAMIYSSDVTVMRNDVGDWGAPYAVDVLTSPAVNAGDLRRKRPAGTSAKALEEDITRVMRERMGRILFLFEQQGARSIVLGSFGTGVFKNDVATVANLWLDLLASNGSRFQRSFDNVSFAVLGQETFDVFRAVFNSRMSHGAW